ncbi:MAG TPA: hypothetical protein VN734_05135 [Acidobacteriaceae bacterium]|nr:hypothetical protein [Acidobacteriaceae bacterium]
MRLKFFLCGVTTLIPALLLAGCGMEQMSTVTPNVVSPAVVGRSFGGQQPVQGATISVVEMGTSGYGSTGTILASTLTDSNGNFSFAPGAYACPQSDTPVYLLGIGGNAGAGNNGSAVEAAALGTCTNAKNSFVVMNEVTTAATAFVLSHFFSTTLGGANGANDWFGGPTSPGASGMIVYSRGLVMGNNVTIPTIVNNSSGSANQGQNGATIEWQKINTIANILSECVNSSGATSATETRTPCGKLFNWTANGATTRPSDTLQAAVQMALFPASQVTNLYNSITGTAPFTPYLTAQPNDWTIGVAYTSSALGLAVDTGTLSTLDIDASGRVWFPSNVLGQVGAAYFDPTNQSFNGPFNTTGLLHPQQVAIDANGYAWYNDSVGTTVPGYLTTAPMTTQTASLPVTTSNAVTIGGDDRVNVGVTNSGVFRMANISADRTSFSLEPGISFVFPIASMAGDTSNGDAVTISNPVTTQMRSYYVSSAPAATDVVNSNDDSGQVIYTGNDYISVRSFSTGNSNDALCIYSQARCFNLQGVTKNTGQGIAIDGGKNLWVAESNNGGVVQVPINRPGATGGAVYLNASGVNNVPNNEFLHGTGDGGTATAPYGIGIDATGNVWVTNAGCNLNDCAPGSFTLTEIVGAGFPTITPVSAQITGGNLVGTEPTH